MVAGMVGNHYLLQAIALGNTAGDGEHDAVAEWDNR